MAQAVAPGADSEAGAVLQATGYVTARRQATVSAQITGTLTAVLIEEGDHVTQGPGAGAAGRQCATRQRCERPRRRPHAAQALVAQYRAQLAQNQHDVDAPAVAGRARAGIEAGRRAGAHPGRQRCGPARSAAANRPQPRDAQAAQAQVNFDYTVVRAPFSGVVTTKDAQVGEIISPLSAGGGFTRTGVGTIVDMDSLEVDVDVNEAYIGRVKPGMPAEAVLDAYPDWKIPAHVIAIVPTADRGKATIKVRVALEKKDARDRARHGRAGVVPGTEAEAAAQLRRRRACWCRPARSCSATATAWCSWSTASEAHQRAVNPAAQAYGELRLLPAAVKPGDSVVVSPPAESARRFGRPDAKP